MDRNFRSVTFYQYLQSCQLNPTVNYCPTLRELGGADFHLEKLSFNTFSFSLGLH